MKKSMTGGRYQSDLCVC